MFQKGFKKGQAALEFLTTYGWAFLILLVLVGGMSYFGVLNPSQFIPNSCIATTGFSCSESQIGADTGRVVLQNGPQAITFIGTPKVTLTGVATNCQVNATLPSGVVRQNAMFGIDISVLDDCTLPDGVRATYIIDGSYKIINDPFPKSFSVEVSATIPKKIIVCDEACRCAAAGATWDEGSSQCTCTTGNMWSGTTCEYDCEYYGTCTQYCSGIELGSEDSCCTDQFGSSFINPNGGGYCPSYCNGIQIGSEDSCCTDQYGNSFINYGGSCPSYCNGQELGDGESCCHTSQGDIIVGPGAECPVEFFPMIVTMSCDNPESYTIYRESASFETGQRLFNSQEVTDLYSGSFAYENNQYTYLNGLNEYSYSCEVGYYTFVGLNSCSEGTSVTLYSSDSSIAEATTFYVDDFLTTPYSGPFVYGGVDYSISSGSIQYSTDCESEPPELFTFVGFTDCSQSEQYYVYQYSSTWSEINEVYDSSGSALYEVGFVYDGINYYIDGSGTLNNMHSCGGGVQYCGESSYNPASDQCCEDGAIGYFTWSIGESCPSIDYCGSNYYFVDGYNMCCQIEGYDVVIYGPDYGGVCPESCGTLC
jgi:hypothetical protein